MSIILYQIQSIDCFPEFCRNLMFLSNLRYINEKENSCQIDPKRTRKIQRSITGNLNQSMTLWYFDNSWYISLFQIFSKAGDLYDMWNWRPITILPTFYKKSSRLFHSRISPILFPTRAFEQHAFTPNLKFKITLLCLGIIIKHSLEYHLSIWLRSMDLRKVYDTVNDKEKKWSWTNKIFSISKNLRDKKIVKSIYIHNNQGL